MALVKTTWQDVNRIACLIVGQAGTGKTSLIRTIRGQKYNPDTNEWDLPYEPETVCILSAESGLLCIKDLLLANEVDSYNISSLAEFNEAAELLANGQMKDGNGQLYQWIFIDSLTEIATKCAEEKQREYTNKKDSFKLWGDYNQEMTAVIKKFRDMLQYNVVFTCLEKVTEGSIIPDLPGTTLNSRITSYFDEVLHITKQPNKGGKIISIFTTKWPVGLAKDRSGKLSDVTDDANLLEIKAEILKNN